MASSINLQQTLLWGTPFMRGYPQTVQGVEPAVTNANIILSTILGPPFAWPFNRGVVAAFATVAGQQDYAQALSDFGYLEGGYIIDGTASVSALTVRLVLAKDVKKALPKYVAAQLDDNAGTTTFRLMAPPDKIYNPGVELLYQKKPVLMTSLASLWSPIPDEMSYIFNWGFLTMQAMLANDPRFPIWNNKFVSALLARAEGIDETQRNIFLANWDAIMKGGERGQLKVAQGVKARER